MKKKIRENRVKRQAGKTTLSTYPELADEIGLNESLMLIQIDFWVADSEDWMESGCHFFPWFCKGIKEIRSEAFPFWSEKTIRRTLEKLIKQELIKKGNFGQGKEDKRNWYTLDNRGLFKMKSVKFDFDSIRSRYKRRGEEN